MKIMQKQTKERLFFVKSKHFFQHHQKLLINALSITCGLILIFSAMPFASETSLVFGISFVMLVKTMHWSTLPFKEFTKSVKYTKSQKKVVFVVLITGPLITLGLWIYLNQWLIRKVGGENPPLSFFANWNPLSSTTNYTAGNLANAYVQTITVMGAFILVMNIWVDVYFAIFLIIWQRLKYKTSAKHLFSQYKSIALAHLLLGIKMFGVSLWISYAMYLKVMINQPSVNQKLIIAAYLWSLLPATTLFWLVIREKFTIPSFKMAKQLWV